MPKRIGWRNPPAAQKGNKTSLLVCLSEIGIKLTTTLPLLGEVCEVPQFLDLFVIKKAD